MRCLLAMLFAWPLIASAHSDSGETVDKKNHPFYKHIPPEMWDDWELEPEDTVSVLPKLEAAEIFHLGFVTIRLETPTNIRKATKFEIYHAEDVMRQELAEGFRARLRDNDSGYVISQTAITTNLGTLGSLEGLVVSHAPFERSHQVDAWTIEIFDQALNLIYLLHDSTRIKLVEGRLVLHEKAAKAIRERAEKRGANIGRLIARLTPMRKSGITFERIPRSPKLKLDIHATRSLLRVKPFMQRADEACERFLNALTSIVR